MFPNCDFITPPPANKSCGVDVRKFGQCSAEKNFGLNDGKPCIFMRFKADSKFTPEYYNKTEELPKEMPTRLKNSIEPNIRSNSKNLQTLWVSCEGKSEEDQSNAGTINIFIQNGFHGYYFPCKSEDLCTSPLVAIQFQPKCKCIN